MGTAWNLKHFFVVVARNWKLNVFRSTIARNIINHVFDTDFFWSDSPCLT